MLPFFRESGLKKYCILVGDFKVFLIGEFYYNILRN